jgi:hypothetical protein
MEKKSILILLPLFIALVLVTASVCVAQPIRGIGHESHHQFGPVGHGSIGMGHGFGAGSMGMRDRFEGPRHMGMGSRFGGLGSMGMRHRESGWNHGRYWDHGRYRDYGRYWWGPGRYWDHDWDYGGYWSGPGFVWGCYPGSYNWPWCTGYWWW